MLIVLDEIFGFEESLLGEAFINRMLLDRHSDKGEKKTSKKISPYTMEDHLDFFTSLPQNEELIIYFFDPILSNEDMLKRLRNWLLPHRSLVPIKIINRAEIICYFYEIKRLQESSTSVNDLQVMNQIDLIRRVSQGYLLSPDPLALLSRKKIGKVFKNKKSTVYRTSMIDNNGLKKMRIKGAIDTIWGELEVAESNNGKTLWIVEKGTEFNPPIASNVYRLNDEVLPNNMPFIHAMVVPGAI